MKRIAGSFFIYFIYSNLFIAVCAALMVNQTYYFLPGTRADRVLIAFVFFSTICSYSFHWYFTSHSEIPSGRIVWLGKNRAVHTVLFFVGLAGAGIFLFYLMEWWPWLLVSVFATFLYSAPKIPHKYFRALRKVALGKTIFLAFVWMYVTSILPVIISGRDWNTSFILYAVYRFFLIYAICILFDYRDRTDDKAAGIRSLITFLSEKGITYLFYTSVIISSMAAVWMVKYDSTLTDILLLLVPCIITAILYNPARKNFSDIFYYFTLDGLMALSALLMLIPGI